ncbi:hypothetical protein [Devosia naphthalenivorans]|uniref:hypothetical protein n=1 Tax=Devosia naphthalenivorans TaxID=2082392 RepID=UPI001964A84E|nr:hypothetical protein [Devosia naphthalenivorans]
MRTEHIVQARPVQLPHGVVAAAEVQLARQPALADTYGDACSCEVGAGSLAAAAVSRLVRGCETSTEPGAAAGASTSAVCHPSGALATGGTGPLDGVGSEWSASV